MLNRYPGLSLILSAISSPCSLFSLLNRNTSISCSLICQLMTLFSCLFGGSFQAVLSKICLEMFSHDRFDALGLTLSLLFHLVNFVQDERRDLASFLFMQISVFLSTRFEMVDFFLMCTFWYLYWKQTACHWMDLFSVLLFSSTVPLFCFGASAVLISLL